MRPGSGIGAGAPIEAGVARLAERYGLPAHTRRQFASLAYLLAHDDQAPTTVRDPSRVIADHLADSLVALELPAVTEARTIADLGSGAGLPGLALAIARPDAEVYLLESSARKCQFLRRAVTATAAANVRVVNERAERWEEGRGKFDVVTARAVGPPAVVAEYAAPLLRIGGTFVAWRGRRDLAAEAQVAVAATELGLELEPPCRAEPFPDAENRYLHLMVKVMDTPSRFPRRPGIAAKRPLGGHTSDRDRR